MSLHAAPRTVLVCDDSQAVRDSLRSLLGSLPRFRAAGEAIDGASCLRALKMNPPDILILDVSMPGGGAGLVRAIRAAFPAVRIVMHSGRSDAGTQKDALSAGADAYVVKAGRLATLLRALDGPAHVPGPGCDEVTDHQELVHAALFLSDDRAWTAEFIQFARTALAGDGRLMVAATSAHRAALQAALPDLLTTARRTDRLLIYSAEETMPLLIPAGRVDEGYFRRELRPAVNDFSAGPGVVSFWGEMAGLTWATGNVVGALQLETLWNDIDIGGSLAMRCPYSLATDNPVTVADLLAVRGAHSQTIDSLHP